MQTAEEIIKEETHYKMKKRKKNIRKQVMASIQVNYAIPIEINKEINLFLKKTELHWCRAAFMRQAIINELAFKRDVKLSHVELDRYPDGRESDRTRYYKTRTTVTLKTKELLVEVAANNNLTVSQFIRQAIKNELALWK